MHRTLAQFMTSSIRRLSKCALLVVSRALVVRVSVVSLCVRAWPGTRWGSAERFRPPSWRWGVDDLMRTRRLRHRLKLGHGRSVMRPPTAQPRL